MLLKLCGEEQIGSFNSVQHGPICGTTVCDSFTDCTQETHHRCFTTFKIVHSLFDEECCDYVSGRWGQCEPAKDFLNTHSQLLYLTHCRLESNVPSPHFAAVMMIFQFTVV